MDGDSGNISRTGCSQGSVIEGSTGASERLEVVVHDVKKAHTPSKNRKRNGRAKEFRTCRQTLLGIPKLGCGDGKRLRSYDLHMGGGINHFKKSLVEKS